ncbi:unnamed protein product [Durusdinium trenchii]|uniref:Uncharacterized protein n=1 Tax=Durusdinium trenchii TaxID=1381693 RepID=A0ABP0IM23_9DINO
MGRRAAYGAPQGRSLSRKVCRRSSICCLGVFIWMQIYLQISFVLSGKERDSSRLSRRSFGSDVQLVFESSIEGYEQLLDSQGLVTDVATAAVLNAASDSVAQLSEDDEDFRVLRVLRYATFGSLDGFAGAGVLCCAIPDWKKKVETKQIQHISHLIIMSLQTLPLSLSPA